MLLLVVSAMVFKGLLSDYCTITLRKCAEARGHWNKLRCRSRVDHWTLTVRLEVEKKVGSEIGDRAFGT